MHASAKNLPRCVPANCEAAASLPPQHQFRCENHRWTKRPTQLVQHIITNTPKFGSPIPSGPISGQYGHPLQARLNMSLSSTGDLCIRCANISFDTNFLNASSRQSSSKPRWSLGSAQRIDASPCPFCRLISRALHEDQRTHSSDSSTHDDAEEVVIEWVPPSRRMSSRPWDRGAFSLPLTPGVWICFVASAGSRHGEQTTEASEYLLPSVPALLDVERVRYWIDTCQSSHFGTCKLDFQDSFLPSGSIRGGFPGIRVLRFVDVEQNCIYETDEIQQYVALSYVWGFVAKFRLTTANRTLLMKPDGLSKAWHLLPTTIKDAILLCRRLKIPYLWVDALCLLQDDKDDVTRGVNVMDQIYEQSWLTIVAACGHDATAGLPGVHPGTRLKSEVVVEVRPGVSLGLLVPMDKLQERSVYNSRAWTFQEFLLARRALHFVDNKIFFSCRRVEYAESCIDQPADILDTPSFHPRRHIDRDMRGFSHLAATLAQYSRRALTNSCDAERALAGIINRFSSSLGYKFHEGLPRAAFDAFIIFRPAGMALQRREGFPSYSWTGWSGSIRVDHVELWDSEGTCEYSRWLTDQTWIVWSSVHRPVWPARSNTSLIWDPNKHEGPSVLFVPNWEKHKNVDVFDGYLERKPFRGPIRLEKQQLHTNPTAALERLVGVFQYIGYVPLHFWTVSVTFYLGYTDVLASKATLVGKDKMVCGAIYLDGFDEFPDLLDKVSEPFEAILLSESRRPICEVAPEFCVEGDTKDYETPTFYNVMLLQWHGMCAERRGIGSIRQSAAGYSLSAPLWKEILLK